VKFDQLLVTARQIGAEVLATGHYARIEYDSGRARWLLKRAVDAGKDQSYFLFGLTQEQLRRTWFPLGGMRKPEVREIARRHGLAPAEKPDSQEICFVPGGDYKSFIDAYLAEQGASLPETGGEMVTREGEVVGAHAGVHRYTVGQRKGLGIATGNPLYVLELRGDRRQVVVGREEELYSRSLRARRLNWIAVEDLREPLRVEVRIRNKHTPAAAWIEKSGEDEVLVSFDEAQRAITPGQAAVFYEGELVVGGGWIA
jgi:tRNA-specific 2-thiouridylase